MSDLFHECGVAAIYHLPGREVSRLCPEQGPTEISRLMPRMLLDIQNRGQLSAGMTTWNPNSKQLIDTYKELGGVSEVFRWTEGLDRRPREAKAFYATIAVATLGGVALHFTSLDPVKVLYWSAVVNGVLAAPLMAVMMVIAMNPRIMGRLTLPRPMLVVGWLATSVMAVATVGFFAI